MPKTWKANQKAYVVEPCDSCEILVINGVICHENGCHNAWKDEIRKCSFCWQEFKPQGDNQKECGVECYNAYHGTDLEEIVFN